MVTRAREQAGELASLLESAGAQVLRLPAIRFAPPASWASLDRAIDGKYAWLIFTSSNGVESFFSRVEQRGVTLPAAKVAAVGAATAGALRAHAVEPDAVPEHFLATELLPLLGDVSGSRIVVVRAAEGRVELIEELLRRGARVDLAIAYRTLPGEFDVDLLRRMIEEGAIDVLTFTSPSTLTNLLAPLTADESARLLRSARLVAIGTTTAAAVRNLGREPDVVASRASAAGILEAVIVAVGRTKD